MPYFVSTILTIIFTFIIRNYLYQPWNLSFLLALVWGTYFGVSIYLYKESKEDSFKAGRFLNMFLVTFPFIFKGEWFYKFLGEFMDNNPNDYEKYVAFLNPFFYYLLLLIWGISLNSYSLGKLDSYLKNKEIKIKVKHIVLGFVILALAIFLDGIE